MVVLSFAKQAALVIQQESGKLERSSRARKEISKRRRAVESRSVLGSWRTSMLWLFPQCGGRGWNAAALWPTSKCASWPKWTRNSLSDLCGVWRSGRPGLILPQTWRDFNSVHTLFKVESFLLTLRAPSYQFGVPCYIYHCEAHTVRWRWPEK